MGRRILPVLGLLLCAAVAQGSEMVRVGDPGSVPDPTRFDERFPEMAEWARAGVEGGIPAVKRIAGRATPGDNLQTVIDAANAGEENKGVVLLEAGTYELDRPLRVRPGVVLRGAGRSRTILRFTTDNDSFGHAGDGSRAAATVQIDSHAGVEDLQIINASVDAIPENEYIGKYKNFGRLGVAGVAFRDSRNAWIQRCSIFKSGTNPVNFGHSRHITSRDNIWDKAYNKGGKGNGYFNIHLCKYVLVFNDRIANCRHLSLMACEYCVVYKCRVEVDINYHDALPEKNLVEKTVVDKRGGHHWSDICYGWPPWQDKGPGPRNFFWDNEFSNARDDAVQVLKDTTPGYDNMPKPWEPMVLEFGPPPSGGTLYAVTGKAVGWDEVEAYRRRLAAEAEKRRQAEARRRAEAERKRQEARRRKQQLIAEWDKKLLKRLREAVNDGRRVTFTYNRLRNARITSVDGDQLSIQSRGIGMRAPFSALKLHDRRALAVKLAKNGSAEDHALAAFYFLSSGDKRGAATHLSRAGKHADEVRQVFE